MISSKRGIIMLFNMVFAQNGSDKNRPKKRGRYMAWGDPDVDDDDVPRATLYRRGRGLAVGSQNDQVILGSRSKLPSIHFFCNR